MDMTGKLRFEYAVMDIEASRNGAELRQNEAGRSDQGRRTQVTSGGHMDALVDCISQVFIDAGLPEEDIFTDRSTVELPGFFRPEKSWDIVVVHEGSLVAAIELKSIWSSYGNNMNNRTEEAVGSGYDFRAANKYGLFGDSVPWLGYVFIIREDDAIYRPNRFKEPHYQVDQDFLGTGYLDRSLITCRRLMCERVYDRVCYAVSNTETGEVIEPAEDMTWAKFAAAIRGKVAEVLA